MACTTGGTPLETVCRVVGWFRSIKINLSAATLDDTLMAGEGYT